MIVLVSDTSVLVDLERGALLDSCFGLPCQFAVPDLLYRKELEAYGGPGLIARGLWVEELTKEELQVAQDVRSAHPKLSVPDAFAYSLAVGREWALLTGDGELRAIARARRIEFHGVLWVCDSLFDEHAIEPTALVTGLEALAAHPRCRLPRSEVQSCLDRYRAGYPAA
jgi:hypothetical protein